MTRFRFGWRRSIGNRFGRLNFSKTGVGWSAGIPGFRLSRHSSGQANETISIPGTGMFWRRRRRRLASREHEVNAATPDSDSNAEEQVRRSLRIARRMHARESSRRRSH